MPSRKIMLAAEMNITHILKFSIHNHNSNLIDMIKKRI